MPDENRWLFLIGNRCGKRQRCHFKQWPVIVVIVVSGKAQLRGLVRSGAQKLLAEQMASDIKGVEHLDNQLDVVDWTPVTNFARNAASRRDGAHRSRQVRGANLSIRDAPKFHPWNSYCGAPGKLDRAGYM
ncbi:MAG TPA: BON domain-containing protein [Tahibacter sp.]|nr:BON domain-containing protein [Tahibacter sp.]